MCTIIALHRVTNAAPLIVAANRDEFYDRAASEPEWIGNVLAARDLEKGGTWIGTHRDGLFVGLTNQRPSTWPVPQAPRSRGEVVRECLERGQLQAALEYLDRLNPHDYLGFNLLLGDGRALWVAYSHPACASRVELSELEAGKTWVLANDRLGSPNFPKAERARRRVAAEIESGGVMPTILAQLRTILADHDKNDPPNAPPADLPYDADFLRELSATCIHTPQYGTRSASLIALDEGAVREYWFASGPPCTSEFHSFHSA